MSDTEIVKFPEVESIVDTVVETVKEAVKEEEEEEVLDKVLETKKPKKERSDKQKAAFAKARETRAENIKKNKAIKEANKKPIGRPKKPKVKSPEPKPQPVSSDSSSSESESEEEEVVIYKKKPKPPKRAKKKKQKVVFISDDSSESESDDEFIPQIQKPKGRYVKETYQEEEYSDSEEWNPQPQVATSMSQFYNFV